MKRLSICKKNTCTFLFILLLAAIMATANVVNVKASELTDVKNTPYEEAANRLNQLGVMVGDKEGFRAFDKIKRSEFTAVVIRALGMEQTIKLLDEETIFEDVQKEHWASKYISAAVSQGIIKGMGNNTFSPDSDVTYEQAVAILVRALGYEPAVTGAWPDGYLNCATSIGLTQDVIQASGTPIVRGDVARLTDQALEIPMMVKGSNKNGKQSYVVSGTGSTKEETLLESHLKLTKYLVQILEISPLVDDSSMRVKILEAKDKSDEGKMESYHFDPSIIGNGAVASLIGTNANILVKDNKLFSLKHESKVIYGTISEINRKSKKASLQSTTNLSDIENIRLKNNDEVYRMNPQVAINSNNQNYNGRVADLLNQYVRIILNDDGISEVDVLVFNEAGIVTSASSNGISYTRTDTGASSMEITEEMNKKPDAITIVIDGNISNIGDIKQGMFFDAWYDSENASLLFVASSKSLTGRLDGVDSENLRIFIEGKSYDISTIGLCGSADNGASFSSIVINDEFLDRKIGAYFDCKGDVRYIVTQADGGTLEFYGVVKKYYSKDVPYAKIVRGANNSTYEIDMELKLDNGSLEKLKTSAGNPNGSCVYKFTPNARGQIIAVESLNLMPYSLAYNSNNIEDFVFRSKFEDPKNDNKVASFSYIKDNYSSGWYTTLKMQAKSSDGTLSSTDSQRQVQFYKDIQVFSLTDQDGKFDPKYVSISDLCSSQADTLSLMVGLERPWDNNTLQFAKVFIVRSGYDLAKMKNAYAGIIKSIEKTGQNTYEVTQYLTQDSILKSLKCKISDYNMQSARFSLITDPSNIAEYGKMVKNAVDVNGAARLAKVGDLAYIFRDTSYNGTSTIGPGRIAEIFDMDSIKEGFNTLAQTVSRIENGRYLFTDCDLIDGKFVQKDNPTSYLFITSNIPIYEYLPGGGEIEFVQRQFNEIKPGDKMIVPMGNPSTGVGKYGSEIRAIIFKRAE